MQNLLPDNTAPTLLPVDEAAHAGTLPPEELAARYPASSARWARPAGRGPADHSFVGAYAFARTGYHRGLDQLRRSGWKGHGPIPWSHEPNRGFLRCLHALARAADAIGEAEEAARCAQF